MSTNTTHFSARLLGRLQIRRERERGYFRGRVTIGTRTAHIEIIIPSIVLLAVVPCLRKGEVVYLCERQRVPDDRMITRDHALSTSRHLSCVW